MTICDLSPVVGWRDPPFLATFKIGHIVADQVSFYEFNSKKSADLAEHPRHTCSKVFIEKKNTEAVEMIVFSPKFANIYKSPNTL